MSKETRIYVADHKNIILRTPQQRDDLVGLNGVRSELIAFLQNMLDSGVIMEITSLKSDHGPDGWRSSSPLKEGTHEYGFAVDWWPNTKRERGAYCEVTDPLFARALRIASRAPYHRQTGLTRDAWNDDTIKQAGPRVFRDDGPSHVHNGVNAAP